MTHPQHSPQMLRASQVAAQLGVHRNTVGRYRQEGLLSAVLLVREYRYPASEVARFIAQGSPPAPPANGQSRDRA